MQISPSDKEKQQSIIDFDELVYQLGLQHPESSNVYTVKIDDFIFIYKPLCRKLYKKLAMAENISSLEKEELVCKECVLWPLDFDFDDCDAGLPTKLAECILKNSYVDSLEDRQKIIYLYRQEMYDVDNQVTCMIHEAFPEFTIEEIEDWDMQKTAEYCSRAEWILANLRGAQYSYDPFTGRSLEELQADQETIEKQQEQSIQQTSNVHTEEISDINNDQESIEKIKRGEFETLEERQKRIQLKKERMTPEKLAELKAKYPEMDWDSSVFEDPEFDPVAGTVDTTAPALRPGY